MRSTYGAKRGGFLCRTAPLQNGDRPLSLTSYHDEEGPCLAHAGKGDQLLAVQLVGGGHAADAALQEIVEVTGYEVAVEHLLQGEDRLFERSKALRSRPITTPTMTSAPKPTAAGETMARTCLISFKRNRYSLPHRLRTARSACGSTVIGSSRPRKGSFSVSMKG